MQREIGQKIDISIDELEDISPQGIVITADDLLDLPSDIRALKQKAMTTRFDFSSILQKGLVAGALGGLVAWLVCEALTVLYPGWTAARSAGDILVKMGFFGAAIGAPISIALAMGDALYGFNSKRTARGLSIGLGVGLVGGFLGGLVGQFAYGALSGGADTSAFYVQIMVRALAWGVVGLFIGLSQGFLIPTRKRIVNSMLGGGIGGVIGGGLFDPVASVVGNAVLSRGVAIIVLGICTGFAISLVEQVAKEAWLQAVKGAFEGKEYIIYQDTTVIGSGKDCAIILFKDSGVSPRHVEVRVESGSYVAYDQGSSTGTVINGLRIRRKVLKNGDVIKLGEAALIFRERARLSA